MKQSLSMDMRAIRARKFSAQIMDTLRDFLPTDGITQDRIHNHLVKIAYDANALIVEVPPEFDALTELAAKQEMIKRMMEPILVEKSTTA